MSEHTQAAVLTELLDTHAQLLHLAPQLADAAADLQLVHGILTTNGALLHLPPGHGRGMAVYPHQALLNHSCM